MKVVSRIALLAAGCIAPEPWPALTRHMPFHAGTKLHSMASTTNAAFQAAHRDGSISIILLALFTLWLLGGLALYALDDSSASGGQDHTAASGLINIEDLALESNQVGAHRHAA